MAVRSPGAALFDPRLLGRHQLAALVATAVDFSVMILLVEVAACAPPVATALSAASGGMANFAASRAWAYRRRHRGAASGQAARYALVSCGGALVNAALLALALAAADVSYVAARAVVAIAVSLLYTYPLHTRFVFRVAARAEVAP